MNEGRKKEKKHIQTTEKSDSVNSYAKRQIEMSILNSKRRMGML